MVTQIIAENRGHRFLKYKNYATIVIYIGLTKKQECCLVDMLPYNRRFNHDK